MFLIIAITLVTLAVIFYFYVTRNHDYWKRRGVPVASGLHWLFGHSKDMIMGNIHFANRFQKVYDEFPNSPYVGLFNFHNPYIMVKNPDDIKAVLCTDFNSFAKNEFTVDAKHDFLLGYNPFVLSGEEWKQSRGHASPLTTFAKLKHYFPNIIKVSDEMVKLVTREIGDKGSAEFETKALSGMFTTDSVANSVFGVANNTFENGTSFFAEVTKNIFSDSYLDTAKITISFVFPKLADIIGYRITSKHSEEVLLSLTRKIMSERAKTGEVRNDIFQQMITFRENDNAGVFTDKYIASQLFSFIADGFETSSNVLCFTLFELAWQTDVQDKLRNEINKMYEESKGQLTVEQVEKCKYLDMVASEGLRMYPPLTAFSKICTIDYTFNNKVPLEIKKGIFVNVPIYALHMDEKYFPNPKKFDPERFTEEEVAKRHKFVYLPFGEGPRKCVGQRFGLLQVKIAIMALVKNFRLVPSPKSKYPVEFDPQDFVSKPLNGAWVQFEKLH